MIPPVGMIIRVLLLFAVLTLLLMQFTRRPDELAQEAVRSAVVLGLAARLLRRADDGHPLRRRRGRVRGSSTSSICRRGTLRRRTTMVVDVLGQGRLRGLVPLRTFRV